jgi:hypothetical protein
MSDEKYFKVIETHEYIVKATNTTEAKQLRKLISVWDDCDVNGYELTEEDLKKYDIN